MLLVVMIGLAQASPAQAQFVKKLMYSIAQDTKRNNCWPKPFLVPDRQAVRTPIAMMVEQGWKRQNLLGDYYFDQQTGDLTEAGELKVRWIATQVPSPHRVIFVSAAGSPEDTASRLKAVQVAAAKVAGDGNPPRIFESDLEPGGWPASQADAIGRKFTDGMPEPVLPDYERSDSSK
jgi:hypothetical protein